MGLFNRLPIALTASVIASLALAEGWLAWRYAGTRQGARRSESRIAQLERDLRDKTNELNRLIFQRDAEMRRQQRQAALAKSSKDTTDAKTAPDDIAPASVSALAQQPPIPPLGILGSRKAATTASRADSSDTETEERELAAAALAARSHPLADSLDLNEGAAPVEPGLSLSDADIDPKHLVNMANMMTGRKVAELIRVGGETAIRYADTSLRDDDPIWHLLDAVGQASALEHVTLVAKDGAESARLRKSSATLISGGVPSSLIRLRAGDAQFKGLEGILITLRRKS